jgi:hypothetical protein
MDIKALLNSTCHCGPDITWIFQQDSGVRRREHRDHIQPTDGSSVEPDDRLADSDRLGWCYCLAERAEGLGERLGASLVTLTQVVVPFVGQGRSERHVHLGAAEAS